MSLLQSGIIGVLAFIFILGAAVTLHEFGHFIVAKLLKIRVETFSIGFGPRLWGFKKGTTDYRVSAIPLGGYVKLGGDESNAPIEGESAPVMFQLESGHQSAIRLEVPGARGDDRTAVLRPAEHHHVAGHGHHVELSPELHGRQIGGDPTDVRL